MSRIEVNGNIDSLLSFYKHERSIFGRCPHCREPFRLSEVKLTYGKEPPRDLLTRLKRDRDRLVEELEALEEQIQETEVSHQEALDTLELQWSERVENEVTRQIRKREKEIRQDAVARSRAGQLGKTLEKIVPMFPGFGHHPYDVRPIFDPIDFIVFDGYYRGTVTDLVFVEFKTGQSRMNPVQTSIRAAIEKKRVHFEEKRLGKEAVRALTSGKPRQVQQVLRRIVE